VCCADQVDRGFQQGEMMTDVYSAMGIEASDSQRLVDAAREVRNVI
jgi:hypothetical protein